MAKRKSNQSHTTQRDDSDVATDSEVLRNFITKPKPYAPIVTQPLHLPSFDNRLFHPDPVTRTISEPRSASRLVIPRESAVSPRRSVQDRPGNSRTARLPHQLAFSQPKQVSVCIRRKARREVLFAKQRTRKGAGSRRHRNQWSEIKC